MNEWPTEHLWGAQVRLAKMGVGDWNHSEIGNSTVSPIKPPRLLKSKVAEC